MTGQLLSPRGTQRPPGTPRAPMARTPQGLSDGKAKVADRHPANGAWEALLTAHSSLIRQFNAQDVW